MIDYKPWNTKFRKEQNLPSSLKVITPLPHILLSVSQSSLQFVARKDGDNGLWHSGPIPVPLTDTRQSHISTRRVCKDSQQSHQDVLVRDNVLGEWILAATVQSYTPNLNQVNWINEYAWFSTNQSITFSLSVIQNL